MKERPILFSGGMVRALLAGRKTQTRRIVKAPCTCDVDGEYSKYCAVHGAMPNCPYEAGMRLWVRETWQQVIRRRVSPKEAWWPGQQEWPGVGSRPWGPSERNGEHHVIIWRADGEMPGGFPERWRPSIFMPRWASRITLEVTDVRVERLWSISQDDAWAEGCHEFPDRKSGRDPSYWALDPGGGAPLADTPRDEFSGLWQSINGKRAPWASNPWVWVVTFARVDAKQEAV